MSTENQGVSVSSPTSTFVIDSAEVGTSPVAATTPFPDAPQTPASTYYGYIHASNAQYYCAKLLGNILSLIDASVANKDQNKAVKHLARKHFDAAITEIHEMAWPLPPGDSYGQNQKMQQSANSPLDNGYILQPER